MRPPGFWHRTNAHLAPLALSPFCWITAQATARRLRRPAWAAPVPVICCGNIGVGGAGKTTLALDLLRRLHGRGVDAHALTRGYGGRTRGLVRVDILRDDAERVGDEALLLAASATTWVAADRAAAARAAVAQGAHCLVMDDGMQNPTLRKDCTLLVIDGDVGFGNGRLLPAGPLRESVARGASRAQAAVLIGADRTGAAQRLPIGLPVLRATLVMTSQAEALHGQRLVAFAGLARPEKFFSALRALDLELVAQRAFADHHRYRASELRQLAIQARHERAVLVTTPKDAARLPAWFREQVTILGVVLHWNDDAGIEAVLGGVLSPPG